MNMLSEALKQIKIAVMLLVLFSILTGLIYPAVVTVIAQLFFPYQANGSLIEQNGKIIGSTLIGQSFTSAKYFWGRPSATTPYPYNATNSSGSNLSITNPVFLTAVKDRIANLRKADPQNTNLIPVDLVMASGSGLDPEISPLAAYYQIPRIAKARGVPQSAIEMLVNDTLQDRTFKILGEPRVNVLLLNIKLDALKTNGIK